MKKPQTFVIMLVIILLQCGAVYAQDATCISGTFIDLEQGPILFKGKTTPEPYFAGFRSGYSFVLKRRTFMSSSWREFADITIGLFRANPGATVPVGLTIHQFCCDWLDGGFPSSKVVGIYVFAEQGYMLSLWGSPDALGKSWYTTIGIEAGIGGILLSASFEHLWRYDTHIPQIGGKIYLY